MAQISDTHFGTEDPAACAALATDLLADPPDLLVVTGDVTQRASAAQFAAARRYFETLGQVPRRVIPGNHDLPLFNVVMRLLDPYRGFRREFGPELAPAYDDGRVLLLCVDATRRLRHKDGMLSASDVEQVACRLTQRPVPLRIVAAHQPLAAIAWNDRHNVAHGARAALDGWIGAGADLFLGGHIHLPYCVAVTGQRRRAAIVLQAGTAVSTRRRGGLPNSYNRIRFHEAGAGGGSEPLLVLERRDHDTGRDVFAAARQWRARRGPLGWTLDD